MTTLSELRSMDEGKSQYPILDKLASGEHHRLDVKTKGELSHQIVHSKQNDNFVMYRTDKHGNIDNTPGAIRRSMPKSLVTTTINRLKRVHGDDKVEVHPSGSVSEDTLDEGFTDKARHRLIGLTAAGVLTVGAMAHDLHSGSEDKYHQHMKQTYGVDKSDSMLTALKKIVKGPRDHTKVATSTSGTRG